MLDFKSKRIEVKYPLGTEFYRQHSDIKIWSQTIQLRALFLSSQFRNSVGYLNHIARHLNI